MQKIEPIVFKIVIDTCLVFFFSFPLNMLIHFSHMLCDLRFILRHFTHMICCDLVFWEYAHIFLEYAVKLLPQIDDSRIYLRKSE